MRLTLLFTALVVLLSFALGASADTGFDKLLQLHQTGPLTAPVFVPKERAYLCFGRSAPDTPILMVVEGHASAIVKVQTSSSTLNRLLTGQIVPLAPAQLPLFNGNILGGRSQAANLLESLRRQSLNSVYFALSVHSPTSKNLAAILKVDKDQDLENACRNTETIEYVCIENEAEG